MFSGSSHSSELTPPLLPRETTSCKSLEGFALYHVLPSASAKILQASHHGLSASRRLTRGIRSSLYFFAVFFERGCNLFRVWSFLLPEFRGVRLSSLLPRLRGVRFISRRFYHPVSLYQTPELMSRMTVAAVMTGAPDSLSTNVVFSYGLEVAVALDSHPTHPISISPTNTSGEPIS